MAATHDMNTGLAKASFVDPMHSPRIFCYGTTTGLPCKLVLTFCNAALGKAVADGGSQDPQRLALP